ncbi:MAG: peptidylprolyl isomerase, partial [Myxococcales bacterium]
LRKDLAAMKLIGIKVRSKIKVSDEDVRAEYARRAKMESADTEVHARHIVIQVPKGATAAQEEEARKRALALAERARSGEDFIELAKNFSEGPSKDDGGDVGFFKKGDMVASFEQAAFALQVGGVSDPVRTPFGWHVIKVEEKRAAPSKPLEQVREELRDRLFKEQMQRHTEAYVEELRKHAIVDIKLPELDSRKGGTGAAPAKAAP